MVQSARHAASNNLWNCSAPTVSFLFLQAKYLSDTWLNIFCRLRPFEHRPQKIDIFFLCFEINRLVTNQNIPFVYNHNKFCPGCRVDPRQRLRQWPDFFWKYIGICCTLRNRFSECKRQAPVRLLRFHTPLDIPVEHIILIQMFFKILCPADFQPGKHFFRTTDPCCNTRWHVCRNWFSKPPRAAVADISLQSVHDFIRISQQSCFININLRI